MDFAEIVPNRPNETLHERFTPWQVIDPVRYSWKFSGKKCLRRKYGFVNLHILNFTRFTTRHPPSSASWIEEKNRLHSARGPRGRRLQRLTRKAADCSAVKVHSATHCAQMKGSEVLAGPSASGPFSCPKLALRLTSKACSGIIPSP